MGLAIIDSLVQMMSGKIFLESQLGVGSIFTITLPRQLPLSNSSLSSSSVQDAKEMMQPDHKVHHPTAKSNPTARKYHNLKL